MSMKLVISEPKSGKTKQIELTDEQSETLYNNKIGDKIKGDNIGLEGYELEIKGGSDNCGFPMRRDIDGTLRKKIFAVAGVGMKKKGDGIKTKKTVAGNAIFENTAQINARITKIGKDNIFEEKKEEATEEKSE